MPKKPPVIVEVIAKPKPKQPAPPKLVTTWHPRYGYITQEVKSDE
jgi:hypothetical protein